MSLVRRIWSLVCLPYRFVCEFEQAPNVSLIRRIVPFCVSSIVCLPYRLVCESNQAPNVSLIRRILSSCISGVWPDENDNFDE